MTDVVRLTNATRDPRGVPQPRLRDPLLQNRSPTSSRRIAIAGERDRGLGQRSRMSPDGGRTDAPRNATVSVGLGAGPPVHRPDSVGESG